MKKPVTVILAAAALALGACGDQASQTGPARSSATKEYLFFDGSSFKRFAAEFSPDVRAVAESIAKRKGKLLAAVIDGQPLTTARITPLDFGEVPPEVAQADPDSIPQLNLARADGFAVRFTRLWGQAEVVGGSGQLEALELAANTPGVRRIFLWSDGIVNEPSDAFNVAGATDQQVVEEIRRWRGKLKGLRGVTVTVVGVGRGVSRVDRVERARRLFEGLVQGNGGKLVWTQTLEQVS